MEKIGKEKPVLSKEHFPEQLHQIIDVIERVRGEGGEAYDEEGGRRNPVKPDTAPILSQLVKKHEAFSIFEMGTAYGFSALHLGFGNPNAEIVSVEFDPEVAEEAQKNLDDAGLRSKVIPREVYRVVADLPRSAIFDMVFIDHRKDLYLPDFQAIEPFLSSNALIVADNVNDRRAENGNFVEYVLDKYGGYILPTEAGLLVTEV